MGNSSSTTQEVNNQQQLYDNYINEYKKVIIAQQEQINQLSSMNLKQNIKIEQLQICFLMIYQHKIYLKVNLIL